MIITQIIIWAYKDYLTFKYPSNMNISIDITILVPVDKNFDTIIDVDYQIPRIHLYTIPTSAGIPTNPINMDDHL
jgi:hypothetical protein